MRKYMQSKVVRNDSTALFIVTDKTLMRSDG